IYGFVRLADEIVDSFHGYNKAVLLDNFKKDCFEAINSGISLNPVLNAFQKTVNQFNIDHELINTFLYSMEMDLDEQLYDEKKYSQYILGSAQVVGLMCLQVFTIGNREKYLELKDAAMKLGSAFQKVNFLRDISADYHVLKRTYFPGVDVRFFSPADKKNIEEDIDREFTEALHGIRQLPSSSGRGVYLAYAYYKMLFRKIRQVAPEKVLLKRVRISNGYKLVLMIKSLLRYNIRAL
ncbi:MAG TPA: squalene/phytoene synthase family protein, partial [Chitinophagaceae bacterium]|nr:squalene/phytoene synthase family protein [Chitinophagaceae bacterium]